MLVSLPKLPFSRSSNYFLVVNDFKYSNNSNYCSINVQLVVVIAWFGVQLTIDFG